MVATLAAAGSMLPGFTVYSERAGGGTVLHGVFPDPHAPRPLHPGYVYLPPGFDRTRRYPVAYLLHGIRGDPGEYLGALALQSYLDAKIGSGAFEPFIAVVPAAADVHYQGEWAGPWEEYVVHTVGWIDEHLPTIASARGRLLAGLSAGGFGAFDIGLRHPALFGRLASWSGYFHPIDDGPFKQADDATLRANDPRLLLRREAGRLRRLRIRFFISTGPAHSRWASPKESGAFTRAARADGIPTTYRFFGSREGHWRAEFHAGLCWSFGTPGVC
jgi:esterase/lipase superfamily enzyme